VADQSHKREMSEAVRGDFERLRARRQRGERAGERAPSEPPERIALTPPRPGVEEPALHEEERVAAEEPPAPIEPQEPGERRSWLRSLLRRG